VGQVFNESLTP